MLDMQSSTYKVNQLCSREWKQQQRFNNTRGRGVGWSDLVIFDNFKNGFIADGQVYF